MPTMTKTWTFDNSRTNATVTSQDTATNWMLYYIKSMLTGQGGYIPATLGDGTAYVTPPVLSAATITNSGNSLAAGTYYYRLTVFVGGVESHSVQEITSIVTGGASKVDFTWATITSNTKYRIYRHTVAGFASGTAQYFETAAAATTFTDDGTVTWTNGNPPAYNRGFWVVTSSCNSSTAVVTAATASNYGLDRWLTVTNVVAAVASTAAAHSWCILRAPALAAGAGTYAPFITLNSCRADLNGTGAAGYVQIYASKEMPSTAAASTTVAPAIATDGWPGNGVLTSTYFGSVFINPRATASFAHRSCFGITSDGGTWYFTSSSLATGEVESVVIFSTLTNAKTHDQYPYWLFQYGAASMTPAMWTAVLVTSGVTTQNSSGRSAQGGGSYINWVIMPTAYAPIITNFTGSTPDFDGTYADWPLWVGWCNSISYSTPGGTGQIKGLVADLALCTEAFPMGGVDNTAGSITSMHMGPFWLPALASPTL